MKSYDLLEAIGNVDDECIIKARENSKDGKRIWVTLGSIAACIALILTIYPFINPSKSGGNDHSPPTEGSLQQPDKMYHLNTPVTSERGTITMTEYNLKDKTVTFVFDKVTDDHYGFAFDGYDTENGIFYNVLTEYDYISLHPYPENAIIRYDGLLYTLNGVRVEELPFAPGNYEIVVDFGGMFEYCDKVSTRILVIGFGYFILGDYESIIK